VDRDMRRMPRERDREKEREKERERKRERERNISGRQWQKKIERKRVAH
jgi:hypothetical protein